MITKLDSWDEVGQYIAGFDVTGNFVNNIIRTQTQFNASFNDALSKGQLASKFWLVSQLTDMFPNKFSNINIAICGGWYGVLAAMLERHVAETTKMVSIDINQNCEAIANSLNAELYATGVFEAFTGDMFAYDYTDYDIVINTSCEHIKKFDKWFDSIAPGTILVLQSNDFEGAEGHVNCIDSADEWIQDHEVHTMYFRGELKMPDYTRFMLICLK